MFSGRSSKKTLLKMVRNKVWRRRGTEDRWCKWNSTRPKGLGSREKTMEEKEDGEMRHSLLNE